MRRILLYLLVFSLCCLFISFAASNLLAQDGSPLKKGNPTKITSMPEKVWEDASIEITKGKEPKTLEAEVVGKIKAVQGLLCFGCVKNIKIDPDLKVPMDPFFVNIPVEGGPELKVKQVFTAKGQLSFIFYVPEGQKWAAEKIDSYLISGPGGVTLEKRLDNFILLDGSAEVFQ
ncbi:MAG: hypothetical protein PVI71_08325 [Desulfobacterales bacterium]|jgi:hypothetical protein